MSERNRKRDKDIDTERGKDIGTERGKDRDKDKDKDRDKYDNLNIPKQRLIKSNTSTER